MSAGQNTVVCSFDPKSPRISAFDIHEWIFEHLHMPENVVTMVQLEGKGVVEDRTQPVEEVMTTTPSSSPKRTKKRE